MTTRLIDYIRTSIDDDYSMEVLYYTLKWSMANHNFTFNDRKGIKISDKFLNEVTVVDFARKYDGVAEAFSLLLSVRALMLNGEYISLCDSEWLLFEPAPAYKFRWLDYIAIIEHCKSDAEFKNIMRILFELSFGNVMSEEDKKSFVDGIKRPKYGNLLGHYEKLAKEASEDRCCIKNNAFLCNYGLEEYSVDEEIEYVGNTAFAYCMNLKTLRFERADTLFGKFPIIECPKLENIFVPANAVDYYRTQLPYYRNIIRSEYASQEECILPQIETKSLKDVFKHKSTSYKYFWLLSILELMSEDKVMTYENLTIKMLSLAWVYVANNGLCLGPKDQLEKYVDDVRNTFGLSDCATADTVDDCLSDNPEFIRKNVLRYLLNDVPYRFLSPWIKYTYDNDVVEKSNDSSYGAPYALQCDCIVMYEDWRIYIMENYDEIHKFAKYSLIEYLKQYNSPVQLVCVMAP